MSIETVIIAVLAAIAIYITVPFLTLGICLGYPCWKEERRQRKQQLEQWHIKDLEMQIEIQEYQKRWIKAWRKKYTPDDPRVTIDEAFERILEAARGSGIPIQVKVPPMPEVKKLRGSDTIRITGSTLDKVPLKIIKESLLRRGYVISPSAARKEHI